MNTAVNEYNYRFKLTDYSLTNRVWQRLLLMHRSNEAQFTIENQLQWYDDRDLSSELDGL